jgi:hypothetical protein
MNDGRPYRRESEMYPVVANWLARALRGIYPRTRVDTYDTSRTFLNRFLEREGLQQLSPDFQTYEIQVDLTAVIRRRKNPATLGFVECKLGQISLRDLSQLLGYSRVALPVYSIIVSPVGMTRGLHYLLNTLSRIDVLQYAENRRIKLRLPPGLTQTVKTLFAV